MQKPRPGIQSSPSPTLCPLFHRVWPSPPFRSKKLQTVWGKTKSDYLQRARIRNLGGAQFHQLLPAAPFLTSHAGRPTQSAPLSAPLPHFCILQNRRPLSARKFGIALLLGYKSFDNDHKSRQNGTLIPHQRQISVLWLAWLGSYQKIRMALLCLVYVSAIISGSIWSATGNRPTMR